MSMANCGRCKGSFTAEEKSYGKLYRTCPSCREGRACPHGKCNTYTCKECNGKGICEHDKYRYTCKECKGKGICKHNKQRSVCKDCKGSQICKHNKQRSFCRDCGGKGICEHNRRRKDCIFCNPESACKGCKCVYVKKSKYAPYCSQCYNGIAKEEEMFRKFFERENFIEDCLI